MKSTVALSAVIITMLTMIGMLLFPWLLGPNCNVVVAEASTDELAVSPAKVEISDLVRPYKLMVTVKAKTSEIGEEVGVGEEEASTLAPIRIRSNGGNVSADRALKYSVVRHKVDELELGYEEMSESSQFQASVSTHHLLVDPKTPEHFDLTISRIKGYQQKLAANTEVWFGISQETERTKAVQPAQLYIKVLIKAK